MRLIKDNFFFLAVFISLLLVLQYIPFIYHNSITPKQNIYLGAERYTPDYYVYLFYINQGKLGKNAVIDYYTNEKHEPTIVHVEYLIAGKIGGLFNLSAPAIYYLYRSLTLILYALCSFWFIGLFVKNILLHRLTYTVSFFWGGIFAPLLTGTGLELKSYFDFYQPPDLLNRLMFEPHKFIGMSLFLLNFYLIWKFFLQPPTLTPKPPHLNAIRYTLYAILLSTGIFHAVTSVSILFSLLFYLVIRLIIDIASNKNVLSFISSNIKIIGLFIPLILPLLYWKFIFLDNKVWYGVFHYWEGVFVAIDKSAGILPTAQGYLFILGPLIILSLLGIKSFIKEHKNRGLLLLSFLLSNIFLFWIGYAVLGTSKHRYYQTPYLLSWSVLAMYGIVEISRILSGRIRVKKALIILFTVIIFLSLGIPNMKQGFDKELNQYGVAPNLYFTAYPTRLWYDSLIWIGKNTNQDTVILSLPTAGLIIPAIPGRRVVVGDYVHSYNYYEKLPMVEKFFSGTLSTSDAVNYIKKEMIDYVFYGPEEKSKGNLDNYKSLISPVFTNNEVIVYKVNK